MLARLETEFASISDGVGVVLERRLATASAAGVGRFTATCLARNPAIICLLSRLGPTTVGRSDARLVDLRIDPPHVPLAPLRGGRATDSGVE